MTKSVLATRRDWLTDAGLVVAALAAIVSSGAALAGLARFAGWPAWLALMLPATIDLYAITATRIWLSRRTTSDRAKRYARANAFAGIAASVAGNAVYHALAAGAVHVPRWVLVVAVSMVPPTVIGALAHLIALRSNDAEPRRASSPRTTRHATASQASGGSDADHGHRSGRTSTKAPAGPERTSASGPPATDTGADADQMAAAVQEYRTSVDSGEPLSERKLADRFGQSRRWARKVIDASRDETAGPAGDERPRLRLAASEAQEGAK